MADVFVSTSEHEGLGIPPLEAMAFGLPAIASRAGAAGEIITSGQDGWLVPPGDPAALAGLLRALVADRTHLGGEHGPRPGLPA
jgi:glycosyltransferase involved in cell wall biosynthesis